MPPGDSLLAVGDAWVDVVAFACCLLIAGTVAEPPPNAVRLRRLRSGTWALVRLRRKP